MSPALGGSLNSSSGINNTLYVSQALQTPCPSLRAPQTRQGHNRRLKTAGLNEAALQASRTGKRNAVNAEGAPAFSLLDSVNCQGRCQGPPRGYWGQRGDV